MRYKIDFGITFLICIFIIFASKAWNILGNYPEIFKYGSIIYQIIDVILFILSNLSIGVAGAIIFYYIQQLLEKKKNFELYIELRRIVLFIFYKHLTVLSEIDSFKEIKQRDNRLLGYDWLDISILNVIYDEINTIEEKEVFKNKLLNHFLKIGDQQLYDFANSFQKLIDEIKTKEDIRYFKESNELIESIYILYNDEFLMITDIYISEKNKSDLDLEYLIEEIVDDYILFLDSTVELYNELTTFIDSIEKKKIMVFIKMLD